MVVSTSTRSPEERQPKGWWVKYYYDRETAQRAVRFIEKQLIHVEGTHAGKPFKLEWWEKRAILKFFGWRRVDSGARRFRVLFIFVPRKNGKSALASAIALYLEFADKEAASQVVCVAADKEQAGLVFNIASQMVVANPLLFGMSKVYKTAIFNPGTNSVFKVLSKRPNTKHGMNLHGVIVDEVHAIEDRELVDVMITSTIARRQPAVIFTSTAGFDKTHFFYGLYTFAKRVQENPHIDETWLPVIYEANPEKWKDPDEWKRCNPNFGVTMDMESFEKDFRIATEVPEYENTFKRLRLNVWTEQDTRTIPMERWKECYYRDASLDDLKKRTCFAGLDLSSTTDLCSLALVFPPFGSREFYDTLVWYWYPEGNYKIRMKKLGAIDIVPWKEAGYITFVDGEVIDYDLVRAKLNELADEYKIKEVGYDPWNATHLATQLQGDGFTVVPTRQGFGTMSDPTKYFISLILGRQFNHRRNPVLEFNARNLACKQDASGNLKPDKEKSKEKIDGIVAIITALSCSNAHSKKRSRYESHGVRLIG